MQQLSNLGYVTRKRGKGTFVNGNKMEVNYIAKHESMRDIIKNYGYTPSISISEFKIVEPIPAVNSILQIPEDEPLYSLLRLYKADGIPMLYSQAYLQASRFPELQKYDFAQLSLYDTLNTHYKTKVATLKREIGAANASQSAAQILQIKKGKAIFVVNNLAYDTDNIQVEYSVSYYRSETIKFTNYMKC